MNHLSSEPACSAFRNSSFHSNDDCYNNTMKRRGTATTTSTEWSDKSEVFQATVQKEEEEDFHHFVNVLARKVVQDLILSKHEVDNKNAGRNKLQKDAECDIALDMEVAATILLESVEHATSLLSDRNNEQDDNVLYSEKRSSNKAILGQSKANVTASFTSNITSTGFSGVVPVDEVFHPDFWCADLDETLDRLQQQHQQRQVEQQYDDEDDVSEVSNISEVTDVFTENSSAEANRNHKTALKQIPQRNPKSQSRSSYNYSVKFTDITVREYPQILGENPGCSQGPSLTIAWEFEEHPPVSIDDFERIRRKRRCTSTKQLILPRETREEILRRSGFPTCSIVKAVRRDNKIRKQRRQTVTTTSLSKALVSTKSKLLRKLFYKKPRRCGKNKS